LRLPAVCLSDVVGRHDIFEALAEWDSPQIRQGFAELVWVWSWDDGNGPMRSSNMDYLLKYGSILKNADLDADLQRCQGLADSRHHGDCLGLIGFSANAS
jgi:hypothetical protein